ncbi:hypothetical protein [Borreliella garinii]|nr:hypothetical protein [Borreliella garinii]
MSQVNGNEGDKVVFVYDSGAHNIGQGYFDGLKVHQALILRVLKE